MSATRTLLMAAAFVAAASWTEASRADDTSQTNADSSQTKPTTSSQSGSKGTTKKSKKAKSTQQQPSTDATGASSAPKPAPPTSTTTTTAAPYEPTPSTARPEQPSPPKADPLLLTAAGVTFFGAYIPSFIVAAASGRDSDKWLYAPLIGPWVDWGNRHCDVSPCNGEGLNVTLLIVNGLVQAGSAALAVASFFYHPSGATGTAQNNKPKVQIMPVSMGVKGTGLGAVGTF